MLPPASLQARSKTSTALQLRPHTSACCTAAPSLRRHFARRMEYSAGAEECSRILPCMDSTCYIHCQKLGYKDPKTRCQRSPPTKGQFYDTCCCLEPEMDDVDGLPSE
ncbi:hypothetical protein ZWY2020_045222 [Hordeum vulgare]|nr:hypothetical protein ZWY2020_045222 [Hordeum vulgare]